MKGFTLVEVILALGLFSVLATLATMNLVTPQLTASVGSNVNTIVADIDTQRLKAMIGDGDSASSSQPHGIYFESNQYTLFKGSSYNASDPDNFIVALDTGATLADIAFPSSQVVFSKRSGDVSGYVGGSDSVTVTQSGISTTITVNRYGSVSY